MVQTNLIERRRFRIEVFSPQGELIKEALINDKHDFYCSGLVPGQKYFLVFTFDGALFSSLSFTCNNAGRVVYITPGQIIFNSDTDNASDKLTKRINDYIVKRNRLKIPLQLWEKKVLERIFMNSHEAAHICQSQKRIIHFKAGNELCTMVK
jgi:hypothetical protein